MGSKVTIGERPVEEAEIHTIRVIEHEKNVEVPVWNMEKLKADIQNFVSNSVREAIAKADISGLLKQAIKDSTKDLKINNAVPVDVPVNNAVIRNVEVKNVIVKDEVLDLISLLQKQKN